jgi:hypothetical protein
LSFVNNLQTARLLGMQFDEAAWMPRPAAFAMSIRNKNAASGCSPNAAGFVLPIG